MAKTVKRSMVCLYCQFHPRANKLGIMSHFVSAGYSRSGIYNILSLLEKGESVERKPVSGCPTVLCDHKVQQKTKGKITSSFRGLVREVGGTGKMELFKRKRLLQATTQRKRLMVQIKNIFPVKYGVVVIMDDGCGTGRKRLAGILYGPQQRGKRWRHIPSFIEDPSVAVDQCEVNVQATVLSTEAFGERGRIQFEVPAGSCHLHQEVSREGCGLLAGPGLGPLCQEITGRNGPTADKFCIKDCQPSQRPQAATDSIILGEQECYKAQREE